MQLINIDKASEFLGISKFTLRQWVGGRKIKFARLGRRILFDIADLHEFVTASKVEPRKRNGGA
jgi:excisionase family DNA binding protein